MAQINNDQESKNLLLHAVINQLEADFDDNEFESMDELLTKLIENEDNHEILIAYLSDSAKENWLEGRTKVRFIDEGNKPEPHKDDILTFLDTYADEVEQVHESKHELMMDDHVCVKYEDVEYFVKKDNSMYSDSEERILDYLREKHSVY